jgi:Single Cache domain 2
MLSRRLIIGLAAAALAVSTASHAQQAEFGTAEEAKAMLEKTMAALKTDKAKTLEMINKGEGGFKDRDLHTTCLGPDGKVTAHPNRRQVGFDQRPLKDSTGKAYVVEFMKVAAEGKIAEVSYTFPRPGGNKTPVPKAALVTKVGDQVCLVSYYK